MKQTVESLFICNVGHSYFQLIAASGDQVTNVGKTIASSAKLVPPSHGGIASAFGASSSSSSGSSSGHSSPPSGHGESESYFSHARHNVASHGIFCFKTLLPRRYRMNQVGRIFVKVTHLRRKNKLSFFVILQTISFRFKQLYCCFRVLPRIINEA